MSTHCGIAVKSGNTYKTIYCHHDGYPSYMFPMLRKNYNSEALANKLVNLGDASSICERLEPSTNSHSFDNPEKGVSVFYHRDRNEKDCCLEHYTKQQVLNTYFYAYIFEDCEWHCYIDGEPSTAIIINNLII